MFKHSDSLYDLDDDCLEIDEEEVDDFLKKFKNEFEHKKQLASNINSAGQSIGQPINSTQSGQTTQYGSNFTPGSHTSNTGLLDFPSDAGSVKTSSSLGSRLNSGLKSNFGSNPSATPEKTIAIIEENESKKMKSAMQGSHLKATRDYSDINETLNLIKKRILFHLDLAKSIKQATKSVYIHTFVYVLIYHTKNLVNTALQILSGEQSCTSLETQAGLWDDFMQSHDHSIQTDSFVRISEKVYKILYASNDKLGHLKDAADANENLREAAKLIWDPEDEEYNEVTDTLDLLMIGLTGSLDKRVTKASVSKSDKIAPADIRRIQLKISACRMMNLIGIFGEKMIYAEFELDDLIEMIDTMTDEHQVLNRTISLNEYLLSAAKTGTN